MKISPEELKNTDVEVQLVDVRLADEFEESHITGAKNNCVLEVDFLSRLEDSAPESGAMTVLYGHDGESHEAVAAFEKLSRKGYTKLYILEGGIKAAADCLTLEKGQPLPAPPPAPDGRYAIDLEESRCEWTGRNLINKHFGTIAFSSGHLDFEKGVLAGGELVLDLKAMTCTDLNGTPMHQVLIDHLQSDDFFDVEKFPAATVSIKGMSGDEVTAIVTIKGVTHQVEVRTRGGLNEEGLPVAQASCSIDRTKWGVLYGSRKFFHRLAGHFVQ